MASQSIYMFWHRRRKGTLRAGNTERICRLAGALLLGFCVAAYAKSATADQDGDRCESPAQVLKETLHISAGGPYVAKAGSPITLHGTYTIDGQTENSNRLTAIGQALQGYLHDHGSYPPAALLNAKGQPTVSWRVLILPYLGQKALYERFDLSKSWDDRANLRLLDEMPAVYRKSGAGECSIDTGFAGIQGTGSLFQSAAAELNGGHKANGLSVTEVIAAGPVGERVHLPWTAPGDVDVAMAAQLGSPSGFSGEGHTFTPLLFLDGTVHLMPNNVDSNAMLLWTHIPETVSPKLGCACALPSLADAGLKAMWDLGNNSTSNTHSFDVTFQASKPGVYTVTLHVFDNFGNEYNSPAKVEVH